MEILFWVSAVFIVHAFVGYPITLMILDRVKQATPLKQDREYTPAVSLIIPVHNEEKVIQQKLENLLTLEYPADRVQFIIASDNSTDETNSLVRAFIAAHPTLPLSLFDVTKRQGKTNAQNEAVETATGDILIFSDANAYLASNALLELAHCFVDERVGYVSGKLSYTNGDLSQASECEDTYWNYDLKMRLLESQHGSITAGNGALYAIRRSDYVVIGPSFCHDSMMPIKVVTKGQTAKYCPTAIAYEKAGETTQDELKRKIRMARKNLTICHTDLKKYNPFACGWFSYFYFSHRYLRNTLWIWHLICFFLPILLAPVHWIYIMALVVQICFYGGAMLGEVLPNKGFTFMRYYTMTILAQAIGAFNEVTGRSKAFWEKAETTR